VDEAQLEKLLPEIMNLKPRGIRQHLDLNKPIFARTAAYGHFGREPDSEGGFSWEKTDLAEQIKAALG
jgi:S-adenosylmethionine synthetase